jgi:putative addiction module killer protein
MAELELLVYADGLGRTPFEDWFRELDVQAQAKVTVALDRLKRGNISNVSGVGESVFELKLDWGPGYRLYFGRDGDRIVILLLGGTKKRQDRDIARARRFWLDYKSRKPTRHV